MNICDYLEWRGDLSFEQTPFGEVDALILSWLSYYEYEKLLGDDPEEITLAEVGEKHLRDIGEFKKVNLKLAIIPSVSATYLLSLSYQTDRFGPIRLARFNDTFDTEKNIQFAAATFVTEKFAAIVFRGTDDSVAGWKEDFDLSHAETVPAQELALAYLKEELQRWNDRPVYVCGHSKGGNLSMYASLNLDDAELPLLRQIYNFDGPGFNKPMESFAHYPQMKEKIITILPESSIIGLLLHHEEDYQIIASEMVGIFQHNALMWQVSGKKFVCAPEFRDSSLLIKKTLQKWLDGISDENKAEMIDVLFGVVQEAGIQTLDDLTDEVFIKLVKVVRNATMISFDQKKMLLQMMFEFARAGTLSVTSTILESELVSDAVEGAKHVKKSIAAYFSGGARRLRTLMSAGKRTMGGGPKKIDDQPV